MQDVYYNPSKIKQDQIGMFADNIKPDRSGEDLLFQVMLDLGILLLKNRRKRNRRQARILRR